MADPLKALLPSAENAMSGVTVGAGAYGAGTPTAVVDAVNRVDDPRLFVAVTAPNTNRVRWGSNSWNVDRVAPAISVHPVGKVAAAVLTAVHEYHLYE